MPAIFRLLADKGNIEEQMMYNTYNMGIGMVLAVDPSEVEAAMAAVREAGEIPYVIGEVEAGERESYYAENSGVCIRRRHHCRLITMPLAAAA